MKRLDPEVRLKQVEYFLEQGYGIYRTAAKIGIGGNALTQWLQRYHPEILEAFARKREERRAALHSVPLPTEVTEEMAFIYGYALTDSHYNLKRVEFCSKELEVLNLLRLYITTQFSEKFTTRIRQDTKGLYRLRCGLRRVLSFVAGTPLVQVLGWSETAQLSFLRAVWTAEGSVRRRGIELGNSNTELMQLARTLMTKLGYGPGSIGVGTRVGKVAPSGIVAHKDVLILRVTNYLGLARAFKEKLFVTRSKQEKLARVLLGYKCPPVSREEHETLCIQIFAEFPHLEDDSRR